MTDQKEIQKALYRRLGNSGLKVSVPILGAMQFGVSRDASWKIEEAEALPLLKGAYDRGINTWDTANVYSNGVSEEIVGKAIKEYKIPRHKIIILTKCYMLCRDSNDPEDLAIKNPQETAAYVNQAGLSRGAIFNQVNASLRRLQTDYIDVLQIHRFDKNTPVEETMKALHDLVQSGKVRYIGASSMRGVRFATMQFCAEKNGWTKFISMQSKYNLLYREDEKEMNLFCNETGVGLIPWGPLDKGRLCRPIAQQKNTVRSETVPDLNEVEQNIVNEVEQVAKDRGLSMTQVALAWIDSLVTSPIIGFSSIQRMDEAIAASRVELSDEEIHSLEKNYTQFPKDYFASYDSKMRRKK